MSVGTGHRAGIRRNRQRGATLLIGLIMLVLLTLHAVSAFNTSTVQLRIVGNMQDRQQAQAAANLAIGRVLSSGEFIITPNAVAANRLDVDVNGDDTSDYRVTVTPTCDSAMPILARDLDPAVEEDFKCIAGTAFGGASLCAASHWNLQAVSVVASGAAATGAVSEIHQGATVRIDSGEARTSC